MSAADNKNLSDSESLYPYPYPSESECLQGLQDAKLEQERRRQAEKTKLQWQQEHPYENMLEQIRKQMLTTKEHWTLSASANNTKQMDALFRHANQLHPQYLIAIKWRDQGMFPADVTLNVIPDMEMKRTKPRSDVTPSHNRLIVQKQQSDEIMIAEFDEENQTWKIGAPEPSPFLRGIRTKNGTLPIGKKISEMTEQELATIMPGSFKTFSENGMVSDVVKCLKTSWETPLDSWFSHRKLE